MVTKEKKPIGAPAKITDTVLLKVTVDPSDAIVKINGQAQNPSSVKKGSIAIIEATREGYIDGKLETEISATLKPKSTTRKLKLAKAKTSSISTPTQTPTSKPTPTSTSKPTTAPTSKPTPTSTSKPTPASISKPTPTPTSKPTPKPPQKTNYTLTIKTIPTDAVVKINGIDTNTAKLIAGEILKYEISKAGFIPVNANYRAKNVDDIITITLEVPTFSFLIKTDPQDTLIKINGAIKNSITAVAKTKFNWEVSKDGYTSQSSTAEIGNTNVTHTVVLEKAKTTEINELTTVKILSEKMSKSVGEVLKKLISMGSLITINQTLDKDTAMILAQEFGYTATFKSIFDETDETKKIKEDLSKLKPRAPIVTIMGHVDHGKTSLLDTIRKTDVVGGEFGGITQHIGAYRVKTIDGKIITFLDTPGHEAFTAMRSRGAKVTDIVVLVVSAVDGVMPQTIEAINHAKDASVPIIVAVNKVDLPTADPQKIRQELSSYGLLSEEWGGDTIMVDISAKKKINIELLLENILIKAELEELKANPDRNAEGIVIEAKLDSRKGTVVTLLVQEGVLKIGDNLVAGTTYGKVRAMSDEHGKKFHEAYPSMPVEILGMNTTPQAGDKFVVVDQEHVAREIANSRFQKTKNASLSSKRHLSLADISAGKTKDLRIILKADVQGSLGALCDALERMSTTEINLKIVHRGAGSITASDVDLAVASDALIVGFNLRPDAAVEKLAEDAGVSINVYRIIYELIADVKAAMEGLLDPDLKEKILGKALIKQVFKLSSSGTISGCLVTEGKIQRNAKVRLLRDNAIIFEGNIASLKRFKEDAKEVEKGFECGIGLENFSDIKQGDVVESFTLEKIARKL